MMADIDNKLKNYKDSMDNHPSEVLRNTDEIIKDDIEVVTNHRSDEEGLLNTPSEHKKEEDINHLTTREILRLFDEGNSPSQIARRLNKGIGEVQLILNLRKR
jgi:DNA-binding NarL/FixJ family response regulator